MRCVTGRLRHAQAVRLVLMLVGLGGTAHSPITAQSIPAETGHAFGLELQATIGRGRNLGVLIDGTVRPDGSVCAIDYSAGEVNCFAADGTFLWKAGRKGRGPGEFELPYRIAADANGRLLVYDLSDRSITWLSPNGQFEIRRPLPLGLAQVNSLRVLPSGEIALAGYAPRGGRSAGAGVHVFDDTLAYLRSFGALPAAKDRLVLEHWGSGVVSVLPDSQLAYAKVAPGEIFVLDDRGRQHGRIRAGHLKETTLDAAFSVERGATGVRIGSSGTPFPRLGLVLSIGGGRLAVNRWQGGQDDRQFWDVYSPMGKLIQIVPTARSWGFPIGSADHGHVLWAIGSEHDEPVLVKLRVVSGSQHSKAN